ncbi:uncharacterized protein LOC125194680 [Salvia hispanica]|uniref:uncharacterized protein LOC125194680 n=1 Tax=Salvia hispanica TaxID=49212 RepID=UPI0020094A71|nr:uncharacterized protein LOC125194680 [Salvia hispanica]
MLGRWILLDMILLSVFDYCKSFFQHEQYVSVEWVNFKDCKDYILIAQGCMDLDYALRIEQPTSPTDYSASYQRRNYEKWEYSNRVSLLIIRCSIPEAFLGTASKYITKASECLAKN